MNRLGVSVDGSRIREARNAAKMTQAQLARKIGSTEKNIQRWENSLNQPRVSSVALIADATGHDIDFFLTGKSADDDEEAASMTLDAYLRLKIREILREELAKLVNAA